jgi:dihydroneopterin aldolase
MMAEYSSIDERSRPAPLRFGSGANGLGTVITDCLSAISVGRHEIVTCVISVKELRINALIGALAEERGRAQALIISVEATVTMPAADDLGEVLDYRAIATAARHLATEHIVLIETFAHRLASLCLDHSGVAAIKVDISKPHAIPDAVAGVSLHMQSLPSRRGRPIEDCR